MKMRSWFWKLAMLGFTSFALTCLFLSSAVAGPVSPLFVTGPGSDNIYVLQGDSLINSWTKQDGSESPLAVTDKVRTTGAYNGPGVEYTLSGTFTGTVNPAAGMYFYDGATDGSNNYSINYYQQVYRFDLDWSNPVQMFSLGGEGMSGITYDPNNNSLWTTAMGGIANYSKTGVLLSSFSTSYWVSGLALDYADGTLWTTGTVPYTSTYYFLQYAKDGTLLSSRLVSDYGITNQSFPGLEFQSQVPLPGTLILLGSGLIGLTFARRTILRRPKK